VSQLPDVPGPSPTPAQVKEEWNAQLEVLDQSWGTITFRVRLAQETHVIEYRYEKFDCIIVKVDGEIISTGSVLFNQFHFEVSDGAETRPVTIRANCCALIMLDHQSLVFAGSGFEGWPARTCSCPASPLYL
jgi:hypothetical protein